MKARYEFKHDDEYREYLRVYFAGLAMAAFIQQGGAEFSARHKVMIAELSIIHADELLKQLNP